MDKSNEIVIKELKKGSEDALRWLFEQYNGILTAFARYTIRNSMLAEDIVQDAFCTLWENRYKLYSDQNLQAYLYKLVRSRCIDFLRKKKAKTNYDNQVQWKLRESELIHSGPGNSILSEISASEAQIIIQKTLEALPHQTREIFYLSRNELLKNKEIAQKKGISEKTVEYHIAKVLQRLRESLKDFL